MAQAVVARSITLFNAMHFAARQNGVVPASLSAVVLILSGAFGAESTVAQITATTDMEAVTVELEMKPFVQQISGTNVSFEMVPIPGGTYLMGSPESEEGHKPDEAPQHPIKVEPFWMGKCEVTWDAYEIWQFSLDIQRRKLNKIEPSELDRLADTIIRPTKPYVDMTFGMGKEGFPAICMTQWAAKNFCRWLSAKTGNFYRLPTEAEWEYACRAGTTTAYSFGDDPADLDEYAWHYDNSEDAYHPVGQKKPNPWGLHDIHGNVAEWTLDAYDPTFYQKLSVEQPTLNPCVLPTKPYPHVVRGGSWDDDPPQLRSAARRGSDKSWKVQDPQLPQSIWYFTDALFVGFRVIRPLNVPSPEVQAEYLASGTEKE